MTKAAFRQSDLSRAIKAAKAEGLPIVRTEISSDGSIRMWHTEAATESDPLEEWKAARGNRAKGSAQGKAPSR